MFPFTYKEKTYHKCTAEDSENGKAWCPTSVDDNGEVIQSHWGDCEPSCFQIGKNTSEEIKGKNTSEEIKGENTSEEIKGKNTSEEIKG